MIPRPPATPTAAADRATGGAGWVRLADQTVAIDRIRAHPDWFTGLFTRARTEIGHAVCQCRPDQPTRLVIRCRRGRYHLATWPGSGDQHDASCPWYRPHATLSGRSMHSTAIDTTDTGTSIRLATPLILRGPARTTRPSTPTPSPTGSTTSTSRGSLGLLALLHYLWEQATLNLWRPGQGQRTWHYCWRRVDEHAHEVWVNGLALADTLWIVPPFHPETAEQTNTAWDRFLGRLTNVGRDRRRGLVLGEIRASEPTDYGVRLRLAHQRASLFMTDQLLDRVQRSYPAVFSNDTHRSAGRWCCAWWNAAPAATRSSLTSPRCSPPPPTCQSTPATNDAWRMHSSTPDAHSQTTALRPPHSGLPRLRPVGHRPGNLRRGLGNPWPRRLRNPQAHQTVVLLRTRPGAGGMGCPRPHARRHA